MGLFAFVVLVALSVVSVWSAVRAAIRLRRSHLSSGERKNWRRERRLALREETLRAHARSPAKGPW